MKAWPKTKLQKETQQGDIITKNRKIPTEINGKMEKKKPTNAAGKCGKRQEVRGKRQQLLHLFYFYEP